MKIIELKPFFTYYGGKYRIAKKYPSPVFDTIIEPFAGSAGYSVRNYDKQVKLYDLNPKVCGVWDYLINVSRDEIIQLPVAFDDVRELNIPQEAKWLIGFWLNKGHVQPCHIPSRWMRDKARPNSYWGDVIRERIANQLQYIRHWKIFNDSYENATDKKATWFIDPPYSSKSGTLYPFRDIDYEHLASFCDRLDGQIIVCEMHGADWLNFRPFVTAKSTPGGRGKGKCREVIFTRGCDESQN